ncbi:hypothetical protein [Thioclava sp. GXIMD4216]|uniref:hypothetical protein n=1 Tax=Thioclava sp. GXIMD4216 TaxID=3131929 RepID=UPI0030D0E425
MRKKFVVSDDGLRSLEQTEAFRNLDPDAQKILAELLYDLLGGENDTSPKGVKTGLQKLDRFMDAKMSPDLHAAIVASMSQ